MPLFFTSQGETGNLELAAPWQASKNFMVNIV